MPSSRSLKAGNRVPVKKIHHKLKTPLFSFCSFHIEIVKKKIKNIYFRVYPLKGTIVVSAPAHLDAETINRAILAKKDWILRQVNKRPVMQPLPEKTYINGEEFFFKGREALLDDWCRKEIKKSILLILEKWQPLIGVRIRQFGVRKMKTRWGSCNINAARIWLNLKLIHLPPQFLEYVTVHEMVHLLERGHNARFKGFMDRFIPDWRNLKKELGKFSL